jgi:hypothetical protein
MELTPDAELNRQRDLLVAKGLPAMAGLSPAAFAALIDPLRALVRQVFGGGMVDPQPLRVPFLLVVTERLASAEQLLSFTHLVGQREAGRMDPNHGPSGLSAYRPIEEIELPEAPVYLLLDVERGDEYCGQSPQDAQERVFERGRSPLTVHEGIALLTQHPATLDPAYGYFLAGSRRGDRRVPALWSSAGAPKLSWCWQGNPHSWLGMASADQRAYAE